MDKWVLNSRLVSEIFTVCCRKKHATLKKIGISPSTWNDWMTDDPDCEGTKHSVKKTGIPVRALVAVCNELHIPASRLFVKQGEECRIPDKKDLVVPKRSFVTNVFDMERFIGSFGIRSQAHLSIKDMLKRMGYSFIVYTAWTNGAWNLRVEQLLKFCEEFGYDLFDYIVENNRECAPQETDGTESVREPSLEEINEKLEKEVVSLKDKVKKLSKEKKSMKEENDRLKVQNSELAYEISKMKQYIHSLENGFTGMVKED